MELLKTVKEKGYYYDRERSINGISGIGAPIFNYTNKVIGAIGAVYISSSMDSEGFEKTLRRSKG
jgi:DNA-binding IclR family transcriptional regulator